MLHPTVAVASPATISVGAARAAAAGFGPGPSTVPTAWGRSDGGRDGGASGAADDSAAGAANASAHPALVALGTEFIALQDALAGLHYRVSDGRAPDDLVHAELLSALRMHLFLTASRVWPLWRDLCTDSRAVDQAEVRLGQLRGLVDEMLAAGADSPLLEARLAVVAEGLARHGACLLPLLRALQHVVDTATLDELGAVWADEQAAGRAALARGEPLVLDNEDADPVGPACR